MRNPPLLPSICSCVVTTAAQILIGQASAPDSYDARLREAGAPHLYMKPLLCCMLCAFGTNSAGTCALVLAGLQQVFGLHSRHESPGTVKAVELQHTHGRARGLEVAETAVPTSASCECSLSSVANHLECGAAEPNPVIYICIYVYHT